MPTVDIDGIETCYEIEGHGPPLLMFSPGGFNATTDNWRGYRGLRLIEQLRERYTCIMFDKRESGRSGGRVERIGWAAYAAQGRGLLDELGIDRAHLMGGCVGCSIATTFAVADPARVLSMVLCSPAGGVRYRLGQHARAAEHLTFLRTNGLAGVVELARNSSSGFTQDARLGPWVSVIRRDEAFAEAYSKIDAGDYTLLVTGMFRQLFDRDTAPGAEPEDLMRLRIPSLVIPGQDASHATSAARYLGECLPGSEYWDVPVIEQTADTLPQRILSFLGGVC